MITIEEMQIILNDIAAEFPPEFFIELNGGIILLPEERLHDRSRGDDLFIVGRYMQGGSMGRYISIYYGSFIRLYGHFSGELIKEELRKIVKHEFRHHIESLAGEDDLEQIDEQYISDYLNGNYHENSG